MYEIDNTIKTQEFNKLQVNKLEATEAFDVLSISLEKGAKFPEHTSPTDAVLVMLEGDIVFHINGEEIHLHTQQKLNFSKDEKHWVEAFTKAKFISETLKNYFNFLVSRTNPAFLAGSWFNTSTLGSIPILGSGLALRVNTFYY